MAHCKDLRAVGYVSVIRESTAPKPSNCCIIPTIPSTPDFDVGASCCKYSLSLPKTLSN